MSISIEFNGESGSILSQYLAGLLIADKLSIPFCGPALDQVVIKDRWGHTLRTQPVVDVMPVHLEPIGDIHRTDVTDANFMGYFNGRMSKHSLRLNGCFAFSEFFESQREEIEQIVKLDAITEADPADVAIHLRCGGFGYAFQGGSKIVHPEFYTKILNDELIDWRHIYLFTDEVDHPAVLFLKDVFDTEITVVPRGDPRRDFHHLASFKRAIIGNSTYSFWATFLGRAEKVYTFKPQLGAEHPHHQLAKFNKAVCVDGRFYQP